jgi:hypothetical protein
MAEVELDVTETTMTLKVPGFGTAVEGFPAPVQFSAATAKFNKRAHTLLVTVPLAPGPP